MDRMNMQLLETFDHPPDELLPDGTQLFPSTVRYGRVFWALALSIVVISPIIFIAGVSETGLVRDGLLGVSFGYAVAAGIGMWLRARYKIREHAERVERNEWHEGVLVFKSGDVVVRFQHLCGTVDLTIETVYLSRADIEPGFSLWRCRRVNFLRLYYMEIAARSCVLSIPEYDLRDDLETLAAHINEMKDRNVLASMRL